MKPAQQKAVSRYRKKQKTRGFTRVEFSIPEKDKELLKSVAANLRAGGTLAENTRSVLKGINNPYIGMDFKEFLEAAPLEGVELTRAKDVTGDIDL